MSWDQMCPRYELAMDVLGKKWTGLMIRVLLGGRRRFHEFRLQMPDISDRLLSERLKELEDRGIITRSVYNTKPVLIEYELTEKGRSLEPVVAAVSKWAERWVEAEEPTHRPT